MHNPYQTPTAELAATAASAHQRLGEPIRVSAGRGIDWLVEGWRLLMRAPLMLLAISLTSLLLYGLVGLIPLLGSLAILLFWPALTAGFFLALKHAHEGRTVAFADLFAPFTELSGLVTLGALYLLAVVVISVVGVGVLVVLGGFAAFSGGGLDQLDWASLGPGLLLAGLLFMVLMSLVAMAFIFAPILVHQEQVPAIEALKLSFQASLRNMLPFLLWGLALTLGGFVLGLLMLIPFVGPLILLAFCVLIMPLSAGSLYCAYRDIFWR